MNWKKTGFIPVLLLLHGLAAAQQFGGFPSGTKWRKIESDTARIIYTGGAGWQASRIASIIHQMAADTLLELGDVNRQINILLHNRTTLANGYVALGPFRSEFYLVPGGSLFEFGNVPWQEKLAIHEYRHVQQYNNFNHGLTKIFRFVLGEQGQDFANSITIPDWFFEGDAVFAETAYTPQGRGRLPYFLSGYQSLWAEGRNYNWMKLRNGSLKDYVPNHYQLGFLMANYGYLKYGNDFWKNVTRDASAFRGLFYPFQRAVKRHSGIDYRQFRQEALEHYSKPVQKEAIDPFIDHKTVSSYYFPRHIGTDSLLYMRTAYNRIPSFYIHTPAGEQRIRLQNISTEEWFSYRNRKIAYTSFSTNPRWSLLNYSDIVLLDIDSRHEKKITEKGRYYTPDLSPDGLHLVSVRINDSLQTELVQIHIESGEEKTLLDGGEALFLANPRYVDEHRIVLSVRDASARMALSILDTRSGKWTEIIPPSDYTTGLPFVAEGSVFFVSGLTGNDEMYQYDIETARIYQLSREQTGNYFPSVYRDSLVYSHFTSYGLDLRKAALSSIQKAEVPASLWRTRTPILQPAFAKNLLNVPEKRYVQKRYRKSTGLFNFHSWRPEYEDPEFLFRLFSNNILNTFSSELFYRYNQNETSHGVGWNAFYGGWFPVISAGVEYTMNRSFPFRQQPLDLNQLETRVGYNIPLNFTRGRNYKFVNFGSNFVFNRVIPTGFYKDSFNAANTTYLHHFVSWSHYLPRAVQHIYPKFGWSTLLQHRHLTSRDGFQFVGNGFLYLPSIKNHSIVLNVMMQETDTNNVNFSNRFAMSRGYSDYYFSRMWKFGGNYHFPLLYPDFGLANIVYFLRVRGNVFYDLSRVYSRDKSLSRDFRSTGGEIFFDTKWWNQLPVSFGFRVSYLLDDGLRAGEGRGSNFFEVILPVGLLPN